MLGSFVNCAPCQAERLLRNNKYGLDVFLSLLCVISHYHKQRLCLYDEASLIHSVMALVSRDVFDFRWRHDGIPIKWRRQRRRLHSREPIDDHV